MDENVRRESDSRTLLPPHEALFDGEDCIYSVFEEF